MSQQPCNSSRPPTVIYYHRISNGPISESAKFWKFRSNDLPIVPNWPPRDTNWPYGLCDGRFGVKWRETISPISSLFFTFTIDQHLNFPATNSPSWTRHFVNDSFLPDVVYLIGFLRIFTVRKVQEMSFLAHSKTTWINRFSVDVTPHQLNPSCLHSITSTHCRDRSLSAILQNTVECSVESSVYKPMGLYLSGRFLWAFCCSSRCIPE